MSDKEMTPERAIIILDQLNTDGRIEVDREELRAAVAVAKGAVQKQIPQKPLPEERYYGNGKCPKCGAVFIDKATNCCGNCGQALDWLSTIPHEAKLFGIWSDDDER